MRVPGLPSTSPASFTKVLQVSYSDFLKSRVLQLKMLTDHSSKPNPLVLHMRKPWVREVRYSAGCPQQVSDGVKTQFQVF